MKVYSTRANRQECKIVVNILNQYEAASGQKINYDQSEVSFSKGVSAEQKEALVGLLKMRRVEKHAKYLGIPTTEGRSKKAVFNSNIDIWRDPWLADETGRFVTSNEVDSLVNVIDIIDLNAMEWREDLILEHFNDRDARSIWSIPLSWRAPRDKLIWNYSKDGNYSVKTSYVLGKSLSLNTFNCAWTKIWEMDVSPKVRHFLWRIFTNTLPVRGLLKFRHLIGSFPWCQSEEESVRHAIFDCVGVCDLWDN